jgi:hypothetical protein
MKTYIKKKSENCIKAMRTLNFGENTEVIDNNRSKNKQEKFIEELVIEQQQQQEFVLESSNPPPVYSLLNVIEGSSSVQKISEYETSKMEVNKEQNYLLERDSDPSDFIEDIINDEDDDVEDVQDQPELANPPTSKSPVEIVSDDFPNNIIMEGISEPESESIYPPSPDEPMVEKIDQKYSKIINSDHFSSSSSSSFSTQTMSAYESLRRKNMARNDEFLAKLFNEEKGGRGVEKDEEKEGRDEMEAEMDRKSDGKEVYKIELSRISAMVVECFPERKEEIEQIDLVLNEVISQLL